MRLGCNSIERVVYDGLCTGCGTCGVVCPSDAISMSIDDDLGIYLPIVDDEQCNNCGICYRDCPGWEIDINKLESIIFHRKDDFSLVGIHHNCYLGHSNDPAIRYNSASGGLITQILIFALESRIIDGALVTRMNSNFPLIPEPFIARTKEEIIEAARSKYCPVPVNSAIREFLKLKKDEKIAVVGLPCHIQGLRKASLSNNKIGAKIVLYFGIVCNHTPTFHATEYLLQSVGISKTDVRSLHYRGSGYVGGMTVHKKNMSDFFIPQNDLNYWGLAFNLFFFNPRCLMCGDKICRLADISFADALLPEVLSKDDLGTSLIISRTAAGDHLIKQASDSTVISVERTDDESVIRSQILDTHTNRFLSALQLFMFMGKPVPKYNGYYNVCESGPSLYGYIKIVILWGCSVISRRKILWPIIKYTSYLYSKL